MSAQAINFLSDSINDNLAAAQLLTDDVVPTAMRLVSEHAKGLALTGDAIPDACMSGAADIYEHSTRSLCVLKGSVNSSSYGAYSRLILMRIAVADSLTHRAGHNFTIASALGHCAYPIGDEPALRDHVARNQDLYDRMGHLANEAATAAK
ncbi:hypothetical protein [Streptomyces violaceusniger]|uniref:Uncharacterized protein n=1 Tax=Streptomyces violaceusniger (strain Tu 4113) TaxID=653045 RepID=G2PHV2_STRV4|nr:hypothetical protein [Streptomyces violaceusniger]AEM88903.1 hypothetical protein Strvi_0127 [Streptomyces violaceusniger Tu 4113]